MNKTIARVPQNPTHEEVIAIVVTMLEEAFDRMVFTVQKQDIWLNSLREFSPTVIVDAARHCIENCTFAPALAEFRKACRDYEYNDRLEQRHSQVEDDPFPEAADAPDALSKALGAGVGNVNSKMLRVQIAYAYSKAVPDTPGPFRRFTAVEEQQIRDRISEFDGVPYIRIPHVVEKILSEVDPFANER